MCRYGILPIENSAAGSVTEVYDLMEKYNCKIVRSLKLKIEHCLLAKPGVSLKDVKEVVAHEQALNQCGDFLKSSGVKVTVFDNNARAAKYVAESERTDIAAIASANCTDLYGLKILSDKVSNTDHNYTRFICISKNLEIYEGANKITFVASASHRPGSLPVDGPQAQDRLPGLRAVLHIVRGVEQAALQQAAGPDLPLAQGGLEQGGNLLPGDFPEQAGGAVHIHNGPSPVRTLRCRPPGR